MGYTFFTIVFKTRRNYIYLPLLLLDLSDTFTNININAYYVSVQYNDASSLFNNQHAIVNTNVSCRGRQARVLQQGLKSIR